MRCAEGILVLAAATLVTASGCGGGGGGGGGGGAASGALPDTARNVVPISVDGALCGTANGKYVNEPCVKVTVCAPGTQTCQVIDDVLLDTGSFGLRLFRQALTVALVPLSATGGGELAECVKYGDLTSDWGPVRTADVVLGGEPAVRVPIQVIDATYPGRPSTACPSPETDPVSAGFNGILGVGAFAEDCGAACAGSTTPGQYFACAGGACTSTAVPGTSQVTNPVAALPQDNNGVVVRLPAVASGGAASADGVLLLGIGTAQDNVPGAVTVLDLDGSGEFRTVIGGRSFPSFADTGSNGLFFTPPAGTSLPVCASSASWFCPAAETSLSATNSGAAGGGSAVVPFQVGNFERMSGSAAVLGDLAGPAIQGGGFDWGLPFFLGRSVYVGLEGRSSSLGIGPYVAH